MKIYMLLSRRGSDTYRVNLQAFVDHSRLVDWVEKALIDDTYFYDVPSQAWISRDKDKSTYSWEEYKVLGLENLTYVPDHVLDNEYIQVTDQGEGF